MKSTKAPKTIKELRQFAHVMTVAFLLVAAFLFFHQHHSAKFFLGLALLFEGFGLVFPLALRPIETLWMKLAHGLGWFNTRLLLSLIFYVILTPLRILLWLMRKDLLRLKLEPEKDTYWQGRNNAEFLPEHYERLY